MNVNRKTAIARFIEFIFYSNYFYGICAVALSSEALLQQNIPLNGICYFFLVFLTTVLYYSYPYVNKRAGNNSNDRTNWFSSHFLLMRWHQIVITIILLASFTVLLLKYPAQVRTISTAEWILIFVFPVIAGLYYGINFISGKYSLRKIGWLKPLLIGFTWSGLVTVYPVLFYHIINNQDYKPGMVAELLFLKNFMFITLLAVMFDIKDYASDCMAHVKTFVVKLGLRKTIFCILFPLTTIGLGAFICYAVSHHFSNGKILLNTIPFGLLFIIAWSLRKRRSILYYLAAVDGLMLVKAICGTIALSWF